MPGRGQTYRDVNYSKLNNSSSSAYSALVNNYNTAYSQAKAANESRYQQMLSIANNTSNQRAADITNDYSKQSSSAMSNLARLGMANTTVVPTTMTGIERSKQAALTSNADELQKTKLGIISSKTDSYPDASMLTSLLAGAGSSGGQSGISAVIQALSGMKF